MIQASMTRNFPNRSPEKKRKQARCLLYLHLSMGSVEIFWELNSRLLDCSAFSLIKTALKELLSRMLSLHGIVKCFSLVFFLTFKLQAAFWMKIAEVKLSRFVVIYTSRGSSQFCVRIRNQDMSRFFWCPVCLFIIYTSEMKLNSHISWLSSVSFSNRVAV